MGITTLPNAPSLICFSLRAFEGNMDERSGQTLRIHTIYFFQKTKALPALSVRAMLRILASSFLLERKPLEDQFQHHNPAEHKAY